MIQGAVATKQLGPAIDRRIWPMMALGAVNGRGMSLRATEMPAHRLRRVPGREAQARLQDPGSGAFDAGSASSRAGDSCEANNAAIIIERDREVAEQVHAPKDQRAVFMG